MCIQIFFKSRLSIKVTSNSQYCLTTLPIVHLCALPKLHPVS